MTKCSFWLFVFRNAPRIGYSVPNPVGTENIAATPVSVKSKSRSGAPIPVILPPSASFAPHSPPSVFLKSPLLLALCTILHAIGKSPNKFTNAPFSTFHSHWRPIFHTEKRNHCHDMRTTLQWHARIKIPFSWDWFFTRLRTAYRYTAFMQKKHLIYVYLCKPSPQIRAEASTCLSARSPIQRLFNSKRGDYPYFLPLTISYILHVRP